MGRILIKHNSYLVTLMHVCHSSRLCTTYLRLKISFRPCTQFFQKRYLHLELLLGLDIFRHIFKILYQRTLLARLDHFYCKRSLKILSKWFSLKDLQTEISLYGKITLRVDRAFHKVWE